MMTRPNILLITTDQQRFDTVNKAGFPYMMTPNLDRLIEQGCCFANAYSCNPVCLAARHNIITGLSAKYHTFDDNYFDDSHTIPFELPTFAQLLSDDGYDTIAIGKMHFQPYRRHNGFHRLHLMDEIPRYREDDDYALYLKENGYDYLQSLHGVRHMLYMQPQQSLVQPQHHGSSWVAKKTIDYLDTKSKDKPFLLWASFIAPHPPFDVPAQWADLYKGKKLPKPIQSVTPISNLAEENKNIANYPNEETLIRARELYYSSISFVDHNIGKILDKLEEMQELDNTFILFTSDHGEMLGDMETYQKFLPYDGSCKIPMIARFPARIKPGTRRDDFVDLNDIMPTFLDLAGVSNPSKIHYPGASLFSNQKDRTVQYVEHQHGARRWVSLRNHHYKYNYYYGGAKEELFDMIHDEHETTNLLYAQDNQLQDIVQKLKSKCIELEEEFGLEGCIKDHNFVAYEDFSINFYRECNPPVFPSVLANPQEKEKLWTLEQELEQAVIHEPIVNLDLLDQDYFTSRQVLDAKTLSQIQQRKQK